MIRLPLLRNVLFPGGKVPPLRRAALLFADLVIRLRLAMVLLRQILGGGVAAICVGELVASGWIVRLFGLIPGLRIFIYVHGEEITTETPYDAGGRGGAARCWRRMASSWSAGLRLRRVRGMLGPMAGDKIRLIENGVDTSAFARVANPAICWTHIGWMAVSCSSPSAGCWRRRGSTTPSAPSPRSARHIRIAAI